MTSTFINHNGGYKVTFGEIEDIFKTMDDHLLHNVPSCRESQGFLRVNGVLLHAMP